MSALLTWKKAGPQAKTGTGSGEFVDDLVSLINSKSGDATFLWEVASSSNTNPFYVVLKRKSGAAGRLMFICFSSAPAGNNPAFLQANPTANNWMATWFPAGNIDTPTNISASSGTVFGVDTGAVKASSIMNVGSLYAANYVLNVFASADVVYVLSNDPAATSTYCLAGGKMVVDANDDEYDAVFACTNTAPLNQFGNRQNGMSWQDGSTTLNAGSSNTTYIRTNYGASDRLFFTGMYPNSFMVEDPGTDDILANAGTSEANFFAVPLVGRTKGIGFPLKFRQLAFGPPIGSAFATYDTTGPVLAATSMCPMTSPTGSQTTFPWLTEFKV